MKHYYVCLVHNKIRIDGMWLRMAKPFAKWFLKLEMRAKAHNREACAIITHCDECKDEYPYFG